MLIKNNFFSNSKNFYKNIKKTKIFFELLRSDIKNLEIPLLQSYEKNYTSDFTSTTVRKFSKYKNIVVIGMGGSILGTKTIYNFFKYKVKKNFFFLII